MTVAADQQPAVPGVEARAGKFRGPSLIPMLMEIQGRLGWRPKVLLRDGLARTLAFYREEREHYW